MAISFEVPNASASPVSISLYASLPVGQDVALRYFSSTCLQATVLLAMMMMD